MSRTEYKLALIRHDQLLREASHRRLAKASASREEDAARVTATRRSLRLLKLQWLARASHLSPRRIARGH